VSHLARLGLALLVSTLTACGGKSSAIPGGEGHGGADTAGSGGTGTSGTGSGGQGQSGGASTGGAGSGGADTCARFDDDLPTSVQVAISNQTSEVIYLGQEAMTCNIEPLFAVADAAGTPLPSMNFCRQPCLSLRRDGSGGCVTICPSPTAVALQPNDVTYTTWDGLFRVQGQLPTSCVASSSGAPTISCDQAKRIQPGTFTFSARAGSAIDCSGSTCQPCSNSAAGGCSTPGGLITGAMHSAETTVVLDASYGVFPSNVQAKAAPNPNPNLPQGDPIAPLTVEIVFRD